MVNFRFHLVSLTAVFLALAAGITIGASVVDRATVDLLERQLSSVRANREKTNAENDALRADNARWGEFSKQAGDRLLQGRLQGVNVFIVGVDGVDRNVMEGFRNSLTAAGASVGGTLWLTGKWALADEADVRQLAGLVEASPTSRAEDLRTAALSSVASSWASGESGVLVTGLRDAAFVEFEAPAVPVAPLADLPRPDSLLVVMSGDRATVPSAELATPLVDRLSAFSLRVLAVQPSRPPAANADAGSSAEKPPAEFVVALRDDQQVATRVSTVDNIDDYRGRAAAVLALNGLRSSRVGHYGFLPGARIVPEATP